MMQIDLTRTKLMRTDSAVRPPNEAEMFALTVALLLTNETGYSELNGFSLELTPETVREVAECIEYRTPAFTRDIGFGQELRQRLTELVGLRISVLGQHRTKTQKPT